MTRERSATLSFSYMLASRRDAPAGLIQRGDDPSSTRYVLRSSQCFEARSFFWGCSAVDGLILRPSGYWPLSIPAGPFCVSENNPGNRVRTNLLTLLTMSVNQAGYCSILLRRTLASYLRLGGITDSALRSGVGR